MKTGIHQHVFTSKLDETNLDFLNIIKDIGYDSVDINVRSIDIPTARIIKKHANGLGLTLMGGGSLPLDRELLSKEKEKRRQAIKYMKDLIKVVVELDSDFYGGVIYSPCGFISGKAPTKEELSFAAEGLLDAAKFAKKYGVRLGLEPVNRYETYILNTIEATLGLIEKIGEENVGILYDTFHMNIEEKSFYSSITAAKDKIFHVHVNENDRGIPGTGHIDWDEVFKALKDIDYRGVVAIESFVDSSVDISKAVCIWRKLSPSPRALASDGHSFIYKMVKKYGA